MGPYDHYVTLLAHIVYLMGPWGSVERTKLSPCAFIYWMGPICSIQWQVGSGWQLVGQRGPPS